MNTATLDQLSIALPDHTVSITPRPDGMHLLLSLIHI